MSGFDGWQCVKNAVQYVVMACRATYLLVILVLFVSVAVAQSSPAIPDSTLVAAKAAILMDRQTGVVLWAKNPDARLPMASTTKIMTAMVLLDHGADKLDDRVTVSQRAFATGGSSLLAAGDTLTLGDLLKAALIRSSNEATVAAAEYLAGNEAVFVGWMNDKAREVGMTNTQFKNPHGLYAEGHYSSARDLAILTRVALTNYPQIRTTVTQGKPPITIHVTPRGNIAVENRNQQINKPVPGIPNSRVDGVKTGYVRQSGRCLVASATADGWQLIAVVLNSPDTYKDTNTLFYHGFRQYDWKVYANEQIPAVRAPVLRGARPEVALGARGTLAAPAPKVQFGNTVDDEIVFTPETDTLRAPIQRGDRLGTLTVMRGDNPLVSAPAIALESVPVAAWIRWVRGAVISLVILAIIIVVGTIYGARAKNTRRRRRQLSQRSGGSYPPGTGDG